MASRFPRRSRRTDALALAALLAACSPSLERHEFRALHMGTEARIVLYAPTQDAAARAAGAAFAHIAALDSLLSDYRPDSELTRVSDAAGQGAVPAGDDLIRVLARALEIAAHTNGAFDPTVGALTSLWRNARRSGVAPDTAALRQAQETVGWQNVRIDPEQRTIELGKSGTRLDFGGIAKGFAADEALRALRATGVTRALIVFGGEVVAGDSPPGEEGWSVALPNGYIRLSNQALATSGDAEQFFVIEDVRRSHVLDPETGLGLVGGGAAVLAGDGMSADAYATAASVVERAVAETWLREVGGRLLEHRPQDDQ